MSDKTGYPALSGDATPKQMANKINSLNRGKMNCTLDIVLATGTSTMVLDERLSIDCALLLDPLTPEALAAAPNTYIDANDRESGACVITHTTAGPNVLFRLVIIG